MACDGNLTVSFLQDQCPKIKKAALPIIQKEFNLPDDFLA
jgi:hypothetical protein